MIGGRQRQAPRAYPFFRLASAVASALLIIVFASDLAINLTAQSLALSAATAPLPAAAPAERTMTDQSPATETLKQAPPRAAAPYQAPLPTQAVQDTAATPAPEASEAPRLALPAAPLTTATPASEPTLAAASGECIDCSLPAPTATEEAGVSIMAQPSGTQPGAGGGEPATEPPTPLIDETEQASRGMTAAPLGMGGGVEPNQAETPGPFLKMAPETPTPEPTEAPVQPTPAAESLPAAAAPTHGALVPPATQVENTSPTAEAYALTTRDAYPTASQTQPFNAAPGLRLAEVILAGVAVIAGIAAILLRLRSGS